MANGPSDNDIANQERLLALKKEEFELEKKRQAVRVDAQRHLILAEDTGKILLAQADAYLKLEQQVADALKEGVLSKEEIAKIEASRDEALKKIAGDHEALLEAYIAQVQQAERLNDLEEERNKTLEKREKLLTNLNQIGQSISGISFRNFATIGGMASKFMEVAHALDQTRVELARTTGFTKAYANDLTRLQTTSTHLGLSLAQAGEVIGGLNSSMTLFASLSEGQRHSVEDLGAKFLKMGIDAATTGRTLDLLTRGMGYSVGGATAMGEQFDKLAQQVGLPTSQLLKDFNDLGPELASFGQDSKRIFEGLTKEARSLGISIRQAFDLATVFDTFEEGAATAGQLNAQLGTQVNNIQLMLMDDLSERVTYLRSEFAMVGKTFRDMTRYERLAVARILGVKPDDIRKLFSDPVAFQKFQKEQEKIADRAESMSSAMENFRSSLEAAFLRMEPFMSLAVDIVRVLSHMWIPQLLMIGFVLKTLLVPVFKVLAFIITKGIVPALTAMATRLGLVAAQTPVASGSIGLLGQVSALSGSQMLGLGKGLAYVALGALAVGAAIAIAAGGIGFMVSQFVGLGDAAWPAAAAIAAFGLAVVATAYILSSASIPMGISTGLLLGLGAAIALVAAGLGAMAAGLGYMVSSVGKTLRALAATALAETVDRAGALVSIVREVGEGLAEMGGSKLSNLKQVIDQLVRLGPLFQQARVAESMGTKLGNLKQTVEQLARSGALLTESMGSKLSNLKQVIDQLTRLGPIFQRIRLPESLVSGLISIKTTLTEIGSMGDTMATKLSGGIGRLGLTLEQLGATLAGFDENQLKNLGLVTDQMVRLTPIVQRGDVGARFFEALNETIKVTTSVTPEELSTMSEVSGQMVKISSEVNAGNTARLDAIAGGIGALGKKKETVIPVKLMLKNEVLGDAILKYVREAAY